jgi:hypothetical protein
MGEIDTPTNPACEKLITGIEKAESDADVLNRALFTEGKPDTVTPVLFCAQCRRTCTVEVVLKQGQLLPEGWRGRFEAETIVTPYPQFCFI